VLQRLCAVASPNMFVFYDSSCGSSVAATRTSFSVRAILCATKSFVNFCAPLCIRSWRRHRGRLVVSQAQFTRYNLLSNQLLNRTDNRLYRIGLYKHSTGCKTRLTTGLTTGCIVCLHDTSGCQTGSSTTGLTTGLTTGCIV